MTVSDDRGTPRANGGALKYRARWRRVHVGDEAYADLRRRVKAAGLLERAYGYYAMRGPLTFAFFAGGAAVDVYTPARVGAGRCWRPRALALPACRSACWGTMRDI